MPSRRALLGRLATVGLLGTSAAGVSSGSTAAAAAPTDAIPPVDGDTVATAVVDPAAVQTVGLPEPWSARLSAATACADVSLDDVNSVTGSLALSQDGPEGAVVVRGSFDPDDLSAAVERRGRWSATRTRRGGRTVRRLRARGEPYAVAVTRNALVVGHAPTVDRAGSHVDAAVDRVDGSGADDPLARYGSLPAIASGDAAVYADLGEAGRTRLESALSGAPAALRASVEAAGSIGVALDGDAGRGDEAGLRYAATLDPTRLTRERLRRLSGGVDAEGALDGAAVRLRGRTVVVDATPTREELFAVHDDILSGRDDFPSNRDGSAPDRNGPATDDAGFESGR
ncbi:hypothetical protein [Halorubrum halodurans]|uniref:Uncharacterized protein n=1 Tax=Halorubrum halodurans TaxID=1383851 RepID=A0A256IF78_9EURY|nr:hypothetical protein [Halorubrum halodurans]OYR55205.1 hypothetical protein DJ70_12350 [Halorubrum halodurans]